MTGTIRPFIATSDQHAGSSMGETVFHIIRVGSSLIGLSMNFLRTDPLNPCPVAIPFLWERFFKSIRRLSTKVCIFFNSDLRVTTRTEAPVWNKLSDRVVRR